MSTITVGLDEKYLTLIRSGAKIWEGRLRTAHYSRIAVGDHVRFQSPTRTLTARVLERIEYASFAAMLQDKGVRAFLPGENEALTLDEAVEVYRGFPGYREGEAVLGAVAFRVLVEEEGEKDSV